MADIDARPISPELATARKVLADRDEGIIARARQGALDVTVSLRRGFLWVVMRRGDDGGLALRMAVLSPDPTCAPITVADALCAVECTGSIGTARLVVRGDPFDLEQIRATFEFTPSQDLALAPLSRDLIAFGPNGDPLDCEVTVEAAQRKMNTALVYFTLEQPDFGKVLYIQNLSSLNDWFNLTGSKPENAVSGQWPELGYRPPVHPETGKAELPGGRTITIYDTIVCVRAYPRASEADSAWQFLDMLGGVYPWLGAPIPVFRHWADRAEATVKDLMHAPEARIEHFGHTYFHPYTASEYPDIMVQLSIASAVEEWGRWKGIRHPMVREIMAGLEHFHDRELGTLRRYLPDVGTDKDADAVDSWYLYHPMLNLANLAIAGDEKARELFLATIDYGIRAARHFEYKWPIMYNMRDFSVIREVAEADQRGQTDVGGIYAWVMLQAFEMTHERRFLDEAILAIEAAKGMRFDLNYQANLTAWGAAACIRLWRITSEKDYLTQSYVYLASFFHNSQIWESEIGLSQHWHNFLGVTCLQDAPYMAAYECFDSFAAFERYLDDGGPDLIPSVKLLVGEYCRYALDRAWYYYPDALPAEAVAAKNRNGYICRNLNFPVEDLYPDGQQAGQVGQEVYGAGAALIYTSRTFRRIEGAPFLLWCDTFVRAIHQLDGQTVSMRIDGPFGTNARIALLPEGTALASLNARIATSDGRKMGFEPRGGRMEASVPADASLLLKWDQP